MRRHPSGQQPVTGAMKIQTAVTVQATQDGAGKLSMDAVEISADCMAALPASSPPSEPGHRAGPFFVLMTSEPQDARRMTHIPTPPAATARTSAPRRRHCGRAIRLTDQQERFCKEYIVDLNATQAAMRAGYTPRSADSQGTQVLSNPKIQARIAELQAERIKRIRGGCGLRVAPAGRGGERRRARFVRARWHALTRAAMARGMAARPCLHNPHHPALRTRRPARRGDRRADRRGAGRPRAPAGAPRQTCKDQRFRERVHCRHGHAPAGAFQADYRQCDQTSRGANARHRTRRSPQGKRSSAAHPDLRAWPLPTTTKSSAAMCCMRSSSPVRPCPCTHRATIPTPRRSRSGDPDMRRLAPPDDDEEQRRHVLYAQQQPSAAYACTAAHTSNASSGAAR